VQRFFDEVKKIPQSQIFAFTINSAKQIIFRVGGSLSETILYVKGVIGFGVVLVSLDSSKERNYYK